MKKIFFICLYMMALEGNSQKLHLPDVINDAYKNERLKIDTLFYIVGQATPFFDTISLNKSNDITIKFIKNDNEMFKILPDAGNKFFLTVKLTDISASTIIMDLGISQINKELFRKERKVLVFENERKIECKLSNDNNWKFYSTLLNKSHITD